MLGFHHVLRETLIFIEIFPENAYFVFILR